MEDHVYLMRSYLPAEFEEEESNEFIDYLVSAYLENLFAQKYQFSFTAFHMLYMSYIYKIKWFLKEQGDNQIEESIQEYVKQNKGSSFNKLFDLSQFQEKNILDKLLKSLSFHANDVDLCKNLVEVRNKCSHASGKIYFKRPQQVENYILEGLDSVLSIQRKMKPILIKVFDHFIEQNWDNNWIEADIKRWIIDNYISQKDIEEILKYKPAFTKLDSDNRENFYKKILYSILVNEFEKLLDIKDSHFLKSLSILMKGLIDKIDVRTNPNDSERWKNTQEIIEEKILPILTSLPHDEADKAQKILNIA